MPFTITTPLPAGIPDSYGVDSTMTCVRCAGSGLFFSRGFCFRCQGSGVESLRKYTPAEKVEMTRWMQWRHYCLDAILARADELEPRANWVDNTLAEDAHSGFDRLETAEPARLLALFGSVRAGRLDAVVYALREHYQQHRNQDEECTS